MKTINQLRFRHTNAPFIDEGRLAVIDIGSSSIRLVVYDDVRRYPYMVLNQKVWAALAENKSDERFYLKEDKIKRAVSALAWFKWLAQEAGCSHLVAVATSAVREAENRDDFLTAASEVLGGEVQVLSGEEEAQLSSLGAVASIPSARGMVIDLGGGSLELSETQLKHFSSFPLGVLSLKNISGGDPLKAAEILKKTLDDEPWVRTVEGGDLVAIGSGMRSVARLHMAATHYPLDITHDYTLEKEEGIKFCEKLMSGEISPELSDLTEKYKEVLPYRAAALCALLKLPSIRRVRFATFGLREGVLFSQLVACPVLDDPLKAFATEQAKRQGRGLPYSKALAEWCRALMPATSPRFIDVAALFAETGWREQPIYRAQSHFGRVLGGAYVGAPHKLRFKLALAAYYAHGLKKLPEEISRQRQRLLTNEDALECQTLGALFQLAQVLDPGAKGTLDAFTFKGENAGKYRLEGPEAVMGLASEEVERLVGQASGMLARYATEIQK